MDNNNNKKGEGTIRARNKTVMLSPELAGQVRAKMASELAKNKPQVTVENQGGIHRPRSVAMEQPAAARPSPINRPEAPTSVRRNPSSTPSGVITPTPPASLARNKEEPIARSPVKENVYREEPIIVPEPQQGESKEPSYEMHAEEVPQKIVKQDVPMRTEAPKADKSGLKVTYTKKSKVIGFLVSFDKDPEGEVVVLRVGRLMVTSDSGASQEGSGGQWNMLIIPDESISGMHAIMKIQAGELHVLDQLSEHGTKIIKAGSNEVIELTQARGVANHGDTLQFGERSFVVCMLP